MDARELSADSKFPARRRLDEITAEHFPEWCVLIAVFLALAVAAALLGPSWSVWATVVAWASLTAWMTFVRPRRVGIWVSSGRLEVRNVWSDRSMHLSHPLRLTIVEGRQVPIVEIRSASEGCVIESVSPADIERFATFLQERSGAVVTIENLALSGIRSPMSAWRDLRTGEWFVRMRRWY